MTDIVVRDDQQLLDVQTGELLPATVGSAARVLDAARTMRQRINDVVSDATYFLLAESQRQGTKTLRADGKTVTLTGGPSVDYDPADLMERLRAAGCPEGRVEEAVTAEVSYKVNRSVLRQLAAANPAYADAIRASEVHLEKPYRAAVK